MIREIIVPKVQEYIINIPEEYLNRKVEILVLPMDNEPVRNTLNSNKDILLKTSGILKKRNIDPSEWQRNIRSGWNNR